MWIAILILSLGLTILGIVYLIGRFSRFGLVRRLSHDRRWLRLLFGTFPILGFAILGIFDTVNTVVIVLHLVVFWLIGDGITTLISLILRKRSKASPVPKEGRKFPIYWTGIAVLLFCGIYLAFGCYRAYHVEPTVYHLTTDKALPGGHLRIAHIADCHIGTTFDGEGFGSYLADIQTQEPDLLVITGDFVDDSTSREDMIAACEALGQVETTYGVFFVYGNHDKGYYNREAYSPQELEAHLEANGVTVLEDETDLVGDSFYVIGRKDRSVRDRMSMEALSAPLDQNRYTIVLNHQPNDYAAEAAAEADLVLSGHTHGGQLIPLGPIGILIGANDRVYGKEVRDNTTFIVTSGISNWELHFKTGTKSEFVIIDIAEAVERNF